jgi:hypothetical protein
VELYIRRSFDARATYTSEHSVHDPYDAVHLAVTGVYPSKPAYVTAGWSTARYVDFDEFEQGEIWSALAYGDGPGNLLLVYDYPNNIWRTKGGDPVNDPEAYLNGLVNESRPIERLRKIETAAQALLYSPQEDTAGFLQMIEGLRKAVEDKA